MKYEFNPDAQSEFLESVGFYESKVQGLGAAFVNEVEAVITLVCGHPSKERLSVVQVFGVPNFNGFRSILCTERKTRLFKYWQSLMTVGDRNIG